MIQIKYKKEGLMTANHQQAEFKALGGLLQHLHIRTDSILSAHDNMINELVNKNEIDDFMLLLWFPGELRVFGDNIISAAKTGKPLFDSILNARKYVVEEAYRSQAEDSRLDKISRHRAEEIRERKKKEAVWRDQVERARAMGLTPAQLMALQQMQREEEDAQSP